jgi:RimJ/RimL family protein N-acetyltransferase
MNFRGKPEIMNLQTSRLFLRPLVISDAPALFEARRDPLVMRYWDWPPQQSVGEVEGVIANHATQIADGNVLWWVAALSPNGPAIGECDLSDIDHRNTRAEVGFLFARAHWGNGYAQEAMTAVIAHAFGPMELHRLWARFHAGNEASRRLLEKLGFAYEGMLRRHVRRDGEWRDCILYGRLKSDR